ncbi:MAG: DUF6265 family protein [Bacteroidota bacterium]
MKNLICNLSCLICIALSGNGCSGPSKKNGTINSFSWLEGHWVDTTNGFYESWWKSENETLHGNGYQISEGDTVFGEKLSIENSGRSWNYIVAFGNEKTLFRLVNSPGDSLVFENPENEFPKRITYLNKGNGSITAIIENPGVTDKFTQFNFTEVK